MGTYFKGTPKQVAALNAYIKLVRATETLVGRINSNFAKAGITDTQYAVLEALHFHGPLHQRDLAEKLLKSCGNITLVIDNLEKSYLVVRERFAADRRFYTILLTPKGKALVNKLLPDYVRLIVEEMAILSVKEQSELERICKLIGLKK